MTPRTNRRFRCASGGFVLDPDTRELLRGNARVPLSPKAFDLLSILVAGRPKAISKSDLQERLWPATFVVEKNLANLVSEIREAIGDDPSNPRFIRTVHRFGYAFRETGPRAESAASRDGVSFRLNWVNGRVTLDEGEHVLGRDPDAEIFLNSSGVSRRHALIRISAGGATIEDLGSKNGTFVGDQRVDGSRSLGDGDIIGVGSVKLTLRVLQTPNSTETEPRRIPCSAGLEAIPHTANLRATTFLPEACRIPAGRLRLPSTRGVPSPSRVARRGRPSSFGRLEVRHVTQVRTLRRDRFNRLREPDDPADRRAKRPREEGATHHL